MTRKEPKAYGGKKQIEGIFVAGARCLIIEDVVTTGSSIIETIEVGYHCFRWTIVHILFQILKAEGLTVTNVLAVINRQQGGDEALAARGITLHWFDFIFRKKGFRFSLQMFKTEMK